METQLLESCPDPDVASRYHPYMRPSRLRGNKCLEQNLLNKFMVRGGGFVTAKHESNLSSLGIVNNRSALGNRTSAEYVARSLTKQSAFMEDVLKKQVLKTVNLCLDGATVCQEQVCWGLKFGVSGLGLKLAYVGFGM